MEGFLSDGCMYAVLEVLWHNGDLLNDVGFYGMMRFLWNE